MFKFSINIIDGYFSQYIFQFFFLLKLIQSYISNVIAKTSTGVKLLVYPVLGLPFYFEPEAATEIEDVRLGFCSPPWTQGMAKAKVPFEIQLRQGAQIPSRPPKVLDSKKAENTVFFNDIDRGVDVAWDASRGGSLILPIFSFRG